MGAGASAASPTVGIVRTEAAAGLLNVVPASVAVLLPPAAGVPVLIAVRGCVLVAVRSLAGGAAIAVCPRCGYTPAARRGLDAADRAIRCGLVLCVSGVAVL